MDYEKLYKDALERAKKIDIDEAYASQGTIAKTIFPELAESEEEVTRKWILDYLCDGLRKSDKQFKDQFKSAIAWLEKQKEQKHPNGCFTCDEYKKGYEEGRRNGFTAGYNKAMKEVEQKEQKPELPLMGGDTDTYFDDLRITTKSLTSREWFNEGIKYAQRLQKEQKPSSKFNPGDWVVYDGPLGHAILQVKDVVGGRYSFVDNVSTLLVEDSDKYLHPLTPKDVEKKEGWKPQPESLEALMYAIEGKWDAISPTSYLSRRLEDLYEGLVNTYNVDESLLAELPEAASRAYTAEDIEELRELKRKIEASMDQKPAEKQDYSGLYDFERAIHRGFLSAGVENVPVTIIKETAKECLAQMKPAEWSEEDDKIRRNLMSLLANLRGNGIKEETYQKYYPWLKSLRCHWKPNDEDEVRLINTSISFLKDFADKGYENAVECIDWLKSKLNGNTCE